jgi:tight adherence protein B
MNLMLVILVLILGMVLVGLLILLLTSGSSEKPAAHQTAVSQNLRALVAAQRARNASHSLTASDDDYADNLALVAAAETHMSQKKTSASSKMTLEKKLRYAKLPITPIQLRIIQVFVTVAAFIPAYQYLEIYLQILFVVLTPQLVMSVVDMFLNNRFKAFDDDYPVLLMSYVSLLKTGMNAIGGLEAAAKGLDEGSFVRSEVELLVERLKLGLTEEQAIGAFGEDIAHPELELFVQGLILSRRVGGQLSATLERLAKQVRKRQQFRKQAVAAVGMEKSSIYVIAVIMSLLLFYLGFSSPELVLGAFKHETGKKIFQGGVALVLFGFWWSKKVTQIKI